MNKVVSALVEHKKAVVVVRKEEFNLTNSLLISRRLKAAALLIVTAAGCGEGRGSGTIRRNWLSRGLIIHRSEMLILLHK